MGNLATLVGILILFPALNFLPGSNKTELLPSQIYAYIFIILCIAVMFGVGFYSLHKKSDFYNRTDFQWFIYDLKNVTDYKIFATESLPKVELIGKDQKAVFYSRMSLTETEKRLFKAFPHLNPNKEIEVRTIDNNSRLISKEERINLLGNIPKELKSYFLPAKNYTAEYIKKRWFGLLIAFIIVITFGLSAYSFFTGTPDFFIFGYKNAALYLLVWFFVLAVLMVVNDFSETKKWLRFFQKDTSQIVWIYTSESKNSINGIPTGKTYGIYIANSDGKKLYISVMSDRLNCVNNWLNLYFKHAVSGYLHQYEDIYKRSPKSFSTQIKNNK